jgi:hypothetical protein
MKYIKTYENFNYHSTNEGLFSWAKDKIVAAFNNPKLKDALNQTISYMEKNKSLENLQSENPEVFEKLKEKIKSDPKLKNIENVDQAVKLAQTESNASAANPSGDKLEPELDKEMETMFKESYMINEELFKFLGKMGDRFLTKMGYWFGTATTIGGILMMFSGAAGWASNIFTGLHVLLYGIFGVYTPIIGLVVIVLGIILLFRKLMVGKYGSWEEAKAADFK